MYREIVVDLTGRLGQDPKAATRNTKNGEKQVATCTLAAKNSRGQTCWFDITIWGKSGEYALNGKVKKGCVVRVIGELAPDPDTGKPRLWETREGETRASWGLNVQDIQFYGNASLGDGSGGGSYADAPGFEEPSGDQSDWSFAS